MERIAELVQDWEYMFWKDGTGAALQPVITEIFHLPYRHMVFVVVARNLNQPLPEYKPKTQLEIRPFTSADVDCVREIRRPSEAKDCALRLSLGQYGLVALHQGCVCGYAWACGQVNPEIEKIDLKLEPGDVFCMDVYTAPEYRGLGVQTALTLARLKHFRALGYQRAICNIERHNAPSLAVWQKKFGSQTIGYINYLRVGMWRKVSFYPVDQPDLGD